jgi:hypothetical protein
MITHPSWLTLVIASLFGQETYYSEKPVYVLQWISQNRCKIEETVKQ